MHNIFAAWEKMFSRIWMLLETNSENRSSQKQNDILSAWLSWAEEMVGIVCVFLLAVFIFFSSFTVDVSLFQKPRLHNFAVARPLVWNSLPANIRSACVSLRTFAWGLKTCLNCRECSYTDKHYSDISSFDHVSGSWWCTVSYHIE